MGGVESMDGSDLSENGETKGRREKTSSPTAFANGHRLGDCWNCRKEVFKSTVTANFPLPKLRSSIFQYKDIETKHALVELFIAKLQVPLYYIQ